MGELIECKMSNDLHNDICGIIENAQKTAISAVNTTLVLRNWLLGMRISSDSMDGTRSERYGESIIHDLSEELTIKYGKGFDKRSLYRYVQFYRTYPEIVVSLNPQSIDTDCKKIVGTVTPQSKEYGIAMNGRGVLSWSHYERLLQVSDSAAREWYEHEALEQSWSVRTLRRNINTQYYDRMFLTKNKGVSWKKGR